MAASDSPSSIRTRLWISIAILVLFVAALVTLDRYGKSRRVFGAPGAVVEVGDPEQVFEVLKGSGATGRTLFLFGPVPHSWRTATYEGVQKTSPQTFVERAALENIVRRIYFVIPEDRWETFSGSGMSGFYRKVPGMERGLYMDYALGLPLVATTPSSLPRVGEPVLVYVDGGRFPLAFVKELLVRRGIVSDLVVSLAGP